jgi:hypothetical protein
MFDSLEILKEQAINNLIDSKPDNKLMCELFLQDL